MNRKYNLSKEEFRHLFHSADMLMHNNYHSIYAQLGWKKASTGTQSFHCWNVEGHTHNNDKHPSLSVNNETGQWFCHACGVKGNFQSYWKEYIKGVGGETDHYADFIIDFLKFEQYVNISPKGSEEIAETQKKIEEIYNGLKVIFEKTGGVYRPGA